MAYCYRLFVFKLHSYCVQFEENHAPVVLDTKTTSHERIGVTCVLSLIPGTISRNRLLSKTRYGWSKFALKI